MSFADDFFNCLGKNLKSIGLNRANDCEHHDFASYFRMETDEIGVYFFSRDNRNKGSGVICDYWFAPLDLPDDRIQVMNIGLKFNIYSEFNFNDLIANSVFEKVSIIDSKKNCLIEIVEKEIASPAFSTRRYELWTKCVNLYNEIKKDDSMLQLWSETIQKLKKENENILDDIENFQMQILPSIENIVSNLDSEKYKGIKKSLIERMLSERAILMSL